MDLCQNTDDLHSVLCLNASCSDTDRAVSLLLQSDRRRDKLTRPAECQKYSTYVNSEIFQAFKLPQKVLQLGVDLQGLDFGIFKEGPELLQSIQLACEQEANEYMLDQIEKTFGNITGSTQLSPAVTTQ